MTSESEYFMDPDAVGKIASALDVISTVLKGVSAILEIQMQILKSTAFIGAVGGLAIERYLATLKPEIDKMADKCAELSTDAKASIAKWNAATQRT